MGSNYSWIFGYTKGRTSYGCNTSGTTSSTGYWTSSEGNPSLLAWYVTSKGSLAMARKDNGEHEDVLTFEEKVVTTIGIRPVITIYKSNLQ